MSFCKNVRCRLNLQAAQSCAQRSATCKTQCSVVMARTLPLTIMPRGTGALRPKCSISCSDSSGESHTAVAPACTSICMQDWLCTGIHGRISAYAPRSRASASSDTLPTATTLLGCTHESKRSWSSSRHTSSSTGTSHSGHCSALAASTGAYTFVAPALRTALAIATLLTNAHTSSSRPSALLLVVVDSDSRLTPTSCSSRVA